MSLRELTIDELLLVSGGDDGGGGGGIDTAGGFLSDGAVAAGSYMGAEIGSTVGGPAGGLAGAVIGAGAGYVAANGLPSLPSSDPTTAEADLSALAAGMNEGAVASSFGDPSASVGNDVGDANNGNSDNSSPA